MGGRGSGGGGKKEIVCLSLHCHHQNDSCIKMGSDENHFNVSVGSDGQNHKTCSVHKPQPFWRERRAEAVSNRGPSAYQPNALPLGQTGSQTNFQVTRLITLKYGRVLCDWNFVLVRLAGYRLFGWSDSPWELRHVLSELSVTRHERRGATQQAQRRNEKSGVIWRGFKSPVRQGISLLFADPLTVFKKPPYRVQSRASSASARMLIPSLPSLLKFRAQSARTCLRTVFFSFFFLALYHTSTFNAMRFRENPFTCQCVKEKKRLKGFEFRTFKGHFQVTLRQWRG